MTPTPAVSLWLSTPNHIFVEIAISHGYSSFILDVEHGTFDTAATDRLLALCRAAGVRVYAKVAAPRQEAIQQMLDRGCNGVIIPHVADLEDARLLSCAVKYPEPGTRSFDSGRTVRFGEPGPDYFEDANTETLAIPMIETPGSLAAVREIASLPCVDALFAGPYDLSLTSGRGAYRNVEADRDALEQIASAAAAAGKSWWMPAWSTAERRDATALGAGHLVVAEEFGFFQDGLSRLTGELDKLRRDEI